MQIISFLLFPLTLIYSLGIRIRNIVYNRQWRKSVAFETNVIVVGNLEAGGTGKTPMIEYLIQNLKAHHVMAVLSRGYMRKSRGFLLADSSENATSLGDEPYQIFRKFSGEVQVAVSKTRETAIPFILASHPETEVILMDDGFQYRTVRPTLSVLLSRYDRLFYKDHMLPSGRLREPRKEAKRANILVVTKCPPDLEKKEIDRMRKEIAVYTKASVYFSYLKFKAPISINNGHLTKRIVLVTGVAHPDSLIDHLREDFEMVHHFRLPDHHSFTANDYENIRKVCGENISIIMTEKDSVRWNADQIPGTAQFFIPVSVEFINDGTLFVQEVLDSIHEYEKPY